MFLKQRIIPNRAIGNNVSNRTVGSNNITKKFFFSITLDRIYRSVIDLWMIKTMRKNSIFQISKIIEG